MSVEISTFMLAILPLAIIIGIASSTVSYTAFGICVPLFFVVFGFGVYESLFMSVFIDLIDSSVLTIIYSKKGKVDFRNGLFWSIFSLLGVVIGYIIGLFLLEDNQDILKNGVGLMAIVLAIPFFLKGFKLSKIEKQLKDSPISEETIVNEEIKEEIQIEKAASNTRILPKNKIVSTIMIGGILVSGIASGGIGIGSGMNFVMLFVFVLKWKMLDSTATGAFMMALVTGLCTILFGFQADLSAVIPYAFIAVFFTLIGTLLGAYYTLKLSEAKINIVVGCSMVVASVVGIVSNATQ